MNNKNLLLLVAAAAFITTTAIATISTNLRSEETLLQAGGVYNNGSYNVNDLNIGKIILQKQSQIDKEYWNCYGSCRDSEAQCRFKSEEFKINNTINYTCSDWFGQCKVPCDMNKTQSEAEIQVVIAKYILAAAEIEERRQKNEADCLSRLQNCEYTKLNSTSSGQRSGFGPTCTDSTTGCRESTQGSYQGQLQGLRERFGLINF